MFFDKGVINLSLSTTSGRVTHVGQCGRTQCGCTRSTRCLGGRADGVKESKENMETSNTMPSIYLLCYGRSCAPLVIFRVICISRVPLLHSASAHVLGSWTCGLVLDAPGADWIRSVPLHPPTERASLSSPELPLPSKAFCSATHPQKRASNQDGIPATLFHTPSPHASGTFFHIFESRSTPDAM